ncbi:tetratricopeptide repeat protein [Desulfobacterota bacterium AH_259_B03_O07]|nr:tetratricopeptide repeat protein [Desulfobacterota bacterium AH_259_B03_O07]
MFAPSVAHIEGIYNNFLTILCIGCAKRVIIHNLMISIGLTLVLLFSLVTPIYSQTAQTYIDSGSKKHRQGDYRGAIKDYTKAIEINPKDAEVYYGRGLTKLYLGQKDSGCLDLSKAGELGYFKAYDFIKQYCN